MADSRSEESQSEEDSDPSLSRHEVDELIKSFINPPSQYRKIGVKSLRQDEQRPCVAHTATVATDSC